jgi:hypothetical protein
MKHSFESFVSFELFVSRVVFQEPTNETRVPVIWVICSIFLGVLDTIPEPFHLVLVGTCDPKPDLISWDWTFKHQSWDSKHTKFVPFIAIPLRVPHNEPWGLEPDNGENQRWTPDPVHCHRVLIHQEITTKLEICTLPCIAIHRPIILVFWIIRMYFATQTWDLVRMMIGTFSYLFSGWNSLVYSRLVFTSQVVIDSYIRQAA